jgi:hypothetical protein
VRSGPGQLRTSHLEEGEHGNGISQRDLHILVQHLNSQVLELCAYLRTGCSPNTRSGFMSGEMVPSLFKTNLAYIYCAYVCTRVRQRERERERRRERVRPSAHVQGG